METTTAFAMMIQYLTKGGIPIGWTPQNLDWLAKAHRRHACSYASGSARAEWHLRWAALIEDLLESHRGPNS